MRYPSVTVPFSSIGASHGRRAVCAGSGRYDCRMEDSDVALRPAQPDFEEGLLFAQLLDTAANGVFRFMLGKAADRVLATEERGRSAECTQIALDVAVANHAARKLYKRLGFVVGATSPRSVILPEGRFHRMAKVL